MAAPKSRTASSRSRPRSASTSHPDKSGSRRHSRAASDGTAARSRNGAARQTEQLNHTKMIEFLSGMLAVEKGGVTLYEKALNDLMDEDLREQLDEFLEQTRRHVELCEEMLERAGGSAAESTPTAEAAEAKASGLMSVEVPREMTDFNNIQNLVLAETVDNWNWDRLSEMSKMVKDRELRSAIGRAVREVARQERRHVDWNTRTLAEIARQMLTSHEAKSDGEEMREEA